MALRERYNRHAAVVTRDQGPVFILQEQSVLKNDFSYQLYIGKMKVQTLHFDQKQHQELISEFGTETFLEEIVLKGLLAGPLWEEYGDHVELISAF